MNLNALKGGSTAGKLCSLTSLFRYSTLGPGGACVLKSYELRSNGHCIHGRLQHLFNVFGGLQPRAKIVSLNFELSCGRREEPWGLSMRRGMDVAASYFPAALHVW